MPLPTPDELRGVRFALARGDEPSYDARQVDDFVDTLVARAGAGEPLDDLLGTRFDAGRGYRAGDVDLLLARLRSGQPVSNPRMEPLAEEPGLFGRLFGRR